MQALKYFHPRRSEWISLKGEEQARIEACVQLISGEPEEFFHLTPQDTLLPISALAPTRARICGIINALRLMAQAQSGAIPKRGALSVEYDEMLDKYLVINGNSTYAVCLLSGINSLPCRIEKAASIQF